MPLQNRVDPFGQLHANPSRGMFTGNRGGGIHDVETRTLTGRRWTNKSWIICACDFKGRQRNVWGLQANGKASWTEMFFLDEVTALAAGHRPCFECRRQQAKNFADAFARGQGLDHVSAPEMDRLLHPQRRVTGATAVRLGPTDVLALPDGAMIAVDGEAHAVRDGALLRWSFAGYVAAKARWDDVALLTPPVTVAALREGYRPVWHPSAQGKVD